MRKPWQVGLGIAVVVAAAAGVWAVLGGGLGSGGAEHAGGPADAAPAEGTDRVAGVGPTLHAAPAPRGNGTIRGRAIHSSERPARGATITALIGAAVVSRATTDADGRFVLEGLAPGLNRIDAVLVEEGVEHGSEAWISTGADDVVLTLPRRPRTLLVRVTDRSGVAVPRFDLRVVLPGYVRSLGTGGEGLARVKEGMGLARDTFTHLRGAFLEVWNGRDLEDRALGFAPARVGPLVGNEREVEVLLAPGVVVSGRVLGPDGPVDAPVQLTLASPKPKSPEVQMHDVVEELEERFAPAPKPATAPAELAAPFTGLASKAATAPDGSFRIALHQPEAAHELRVVPPEGFLPEKAIAVNPGDPPLEIRLRRAVRARITVVDADGKPVPEASVSARRILVAQPAPDPAAAPGGAPLPAPTSVAPWDDESHPRATTDKDGVATLTTLHPGAIYHLEVDRPGPSYTFVAGQGAKEVQRTGRGFVKEVEIEAWSPADTRVVLPWGFAVKGMVIDDGGKPVPEASVQLRTGSSMDFEQTDAEGRFTFEGVTPGRVTVVANVGEGGWSFGPVRIGRLGEPETEEVRPDRVELEVVRDHEGIVLRVPSTSSVTLRLPAPASDGKPNLKDILGLVSSGQASVRRRDGSGWRHVQSVWFAPGILEGKPDSSATVTGLEAGTEYHVWLPPKDGAYVDQAFRGDVGTLLLQRRTGGNVAGTVRGLPAGARPPRVNLRDEQGRSVSGVKCDAEGRFEVRGLPEATWTVTARHEVEGQPTLVAEGTVRTGSAVDLTLAPAKDDKGPVPSSPFEIVEEALTEEPQVLPLPPSGR